MDKLFSIIVPVHNTENYIKECVESILDKAQNEVEIILVNDGSTDKSGEICDEYVKAYPTIVKAIHQKAQGVSVARNTGVSNAKGDYIVFVDSDDLLKENSISTLKQNIAQFNYPDLLVYRFESFYYDGRVIPGFFNKLTKYNTLIDPSENPQVITFNNSLCLYAIKRSIYTQNNIVFPGGLVYEDLCTTPKLISCCKTVVFIPDVFYLYRIRQGSIMHSGKIESFNDLVPIIENLTDWFKQNGRYELYKDELCYLTLLNLVLSTSKAVLSICRYHSILDKLLDFTNESFPNWEQNKYLRLLPKKDRFWCFMLKRKMYFAIWCWTKFKATLRKLIYGEKARFDS